MTEVTSTRIQWKTLINTGNFMRADLLFYSQERTCSMELLILLTVTRFQVGRVA
jgi:hypothetical protein